MRTYVPTEEEFALLLRACTMVRCHRDLSFPPPHRPMERVQERYKFAWYGLELVLEVYAHGLQSLKSDGWFFVVPVNRDVNSAARGAMNVHDEERFSREILYLKMYFSA